MLKTTVDALMGLKNLEASFIHLLCAAPAPHTAALLGKGNHSQHLVIGVALFLGQGSRAKQDRFVLFAAFLSCPVFIRG